MSTFEKLAMALIVCAILAIGAYASDRLSAAEDAAAKWRWDNITKPAIDDCRKRGGIANLDSWNGRVLCDR
jgi:hypothetical protein